MWGEPSGDTIGTVKSKANGFYSITTLKGVTIQVPTSSRLTVLAWALPDEESNLNDVLELVKEVQELSEAVKEKADPLDA